MRYSGEQVTCLSPDTSTGLFQDSCSPSWVPERHRSDSQPVDIGLGKAIKSIGENVPLFWPRARVPVGLVGAANVHGGHRP
jgi:hypothetical protein